MKSQLWELFRDTGEPMGYLLYCSEEGKTALGDIYAAMPEYRDVRMSEYYVSENKSPGSAGSEI